MLVKHTDDNKLIKYPYTVSMLRLENPNVSFPSSITEEILKSYNVATVSPVELPFYSYDKKLVEGNPVYKNGAWTQTWKVIKLSEEEIEELKVKVSEENRIKRNELLTDSDWTQLLNSPLSDAKRTLWATYRQQLRDITSQTNWPFVVEWPSKPE